MHSKLRFTFSESNIETLKPLEVWRPQFTCQALKINLSLFCSLCVHVFKSWKLLERKLNERLIKTWHPLGCAFCGSDQVYTPPLQVKRDYQVSTFTLETV